MTEVKVRKKDIQEARRPDAVLTGAASVFDWLYANRNVVIGGLVGVLVLIGVVRAVQASSSARSEAIGAKLSEAVDLPLRPVVEKPDTSEGEPRVDTFPSKDAKNAAINQAFQKLIDEHGDTPAGRSAALNLAQVRYGEGKYDEAISLAQKYIDNPDGSGLIAFAHETQGEAYAAKKEWAKAEESFKKMSGAGLPALSLFYQARLLEQQGKKEEARALYQQVTKEYEEETVAGDARARLDVLDMPASGGDLAPPDEPTPPEPSPKAKPGTKVNKPAPVKAGPK